jgi:hypothetical protein
VVLSSPLSERAATAYAELFETARGLELHRDIASLSGGFAAKTVKGKRYWYYQYRDVDDAVRQLYVGPDDERVRALIARTKQATDHDQIVPMARAAIELGCEPIAPPHFMVIKRVAEYGFFRAGGVLVGTHAFIGLAASLAVRWASSSRTEDVDFAFPDKHLEIALPADLVVDVPAAVESLALGFLPTSAFNASGSDATYVAAKHNMRIDFLTTRKRSDAPLHVSNLKVAMQPLAYMEMLLEHPVQIALVARGGAVIVNAPDPINLAIHKLIVATARGTSWRTKAVKDLAQAAALFEVLETTESAQVAKRWSEVLRRGPTWKKKLLAGRKALVAKHGDSPFRDLLRD